MAAGDDGDGPPSRRDGIARLFYNFGVTAHSRRSGGKSHQCRASGTMETGGMRAT